MVRNVIFQNENLYVIRPGSNKYVNQSIFYFKAPVWIPLDIMMRIRLFKNILWFPMKLFLTISTEGEGVLFDLYNFGWLESITSWIISWKDLKLLKGCGVRVGAVNITHKKEPNHYLCNSSWNISLELREDKDNHEHPENMSKIGRTLSIRTAVKTMTIMTISKMA